MKQVVKKVFLDLESEVVNKGLCSRCNVCIDACPAKAIAESDKKNSYKPALQGTCVSCGACYKVCAGERFNFPEMADYVFGKKAENTYLGCYKSIYLGHANENSIRESGGSGGAVTALLLYLLKTGQITGASVITSLEEKPWQFTRKIVETEEGIIRAAQSKYTVVQVIDEKSRLSGYKGKLAFVGLPCQIHALRKYEKTFGKPLGNIKFYIGLYCGTQLYFDATESILKRFGIKDYAKIKSIEYRSGRWPGEFKISMKDGNIFSMKRITFNYLNLFYKVKRCLSCIDLTSEYADISCGDGWMRENDVTSGGYSVVLSRTEIGEKLLKQAKADNVLTLQPISEKNALEMHSHLLDNKKIGSFLRMETARCMGGNIPDYNVSYPRVSAKRRLREFFIDSLFFLGYLKISRVIANFIPLSLIENMVTNARKKWLLTSRNKITEKSKKG